RTLGGVPVSPSSLRDDVPADLDALCHRTMTGQGPRTPSELIRELAPWRDINLETLASDQPVFPVGQRPAAAVAAPGVEAAASGPSAGAAVAGAAGAVAAGATGAAPAPDATTSAAAAEDVDAPDGSSNGPSADSAPDVAAPPVEEPASAASSDTSHDRPEQQPDG